MGDRTTVYIEVLKSDKRRMLKVLGKPVDEQSESRTSRTIRLTFEDVNGGGFDLLSGLAKDGLSFRGSHCEGIEYYGMTFAAHGGELTEVASPYGELMVRIDPKTLEPSSPDLAALRRWREADDRVLASFERRRKRGAQPDPSRTA